MSEPAGTMEKCSSCDRSIELCDFCDEPNCGAASCHRCLNVSLGQAMPHPHVHAADLRYESDSTTRP